MTGLIEWRTGAASPAAAFVQATAVVRNGCSPLTALGVEHTKVTFQADRQLTALLARALHVECAEQAWKSALKELQSLKRAGLAHETYMAYWNLTHTADGDLYGLVRLSEDLFKRRGKRVVRLTVKLNVAVQSHQRGRMGTLLVSFDVERRPDEAGLDQLGNCRICRGRHRLLRLPARLTSHGRGACRCAFRPFARPRRDRLLYAR